MQTLTYLASSDNTYFDIYISPSNTRIIAHTKVDISQNILIYEGFIQFLKTQTIYEMSPISGMAIS